MKNILILLVVVNTGYSQWAVQNSGTNRSLNDAYFFSVNKGWIAGDKGIILRTTNGGVYWDNHTFDTNYTLNCISFVNEFTGYATGTYYDNVMVQYNVVLKTTNSGVNWGVVYNINDINGRMSVKSVSFFNASTGILIMSGSTGFTATGRLLKTTNGGLNWTDINFWQYTSFRDVVCVSESLAYLFAGYWTDLIGTDSQYVYITTDVGNTWTKIFNKKHSGLLNMYVSNGIINLTGFKPPWDGGRLIRSLNAGGTWDTLVNGNLPALNPAFFFNSSTGWVAEERNIHYTTNAGVSWNLQQTAQNIIMDIHMFNTCTGWAIGYNGTILKTTNCGITGLKIINGNVPSQFSLSQNYPNPFNPSTHIKFQIPKSEFVKLIIFDVLGKEIQTLVNQQLSPGTYSADFDGSSLPSGVYYYRLETQNFSETKKTVLVK